MKYNFPIIETINDVLPHIAGRTEFIVAEREDYTVINYMVNMPDTFDIDESNPLTGLIRRECRGIKFYPDGKIAARVFHKWFNVGERDETQPHMIDLSKSHVIEEKRDGSMIHPMLIQGKIRWMTKMGLSDVALQAEKFIDKQSKYSKFAEWCINNDLTPSFEYTSPANRIVISYETDELVLLSVRKNLTGEYLRIR